MLATRPSFDISNSPTPFAGSYHTGIKRPIQELYFEPGVPKSSLQDELADSNFDLHPAKRARVGGTPRKFPPIIRDLDLIDSSDELETTPATNPAKVIAPTNDPVKPSPPIFDARSERIHGNGPSDIIENSLSGPSLDETAQARHQNDLRFKSRMESIFEKYSRDFTDVGDEIDLMTGEIVVDNGHLSNMTHEWDVGFGDKPERQKDDTQSEDIHGFITQVIAPITTPQPLRKAKVRPVRSNTNKLYKKPEEDEWQTESSDDSDSDHTINQSTSNLPSAKAKFSGQISTILSALKSSGIDDSVATEVLRSAMQTLSTTSPRLTPKSTIRRKSRSLSEASEKLGIWGAQFSPPRNQDRYRPSKFVPFSLAEDTLICHLRDNLHLGWKDIGSKFVTRTTRALQRRYLKLKSEEGNTESEYTDADDNDNMIEDTASDGEIEIWKKFGASTDLGRPQLGFSIQLPTRQTPTIISEVITLPSQPTQPATPESHPADDMGELPMSPQPEPSTSWSAIPTVEPGCNEIVVPPVNVLDESTVLKITAEAAPPGPTCAEPVPSVADVEMEISTPLLMYENALEQLVLEETGIGLGTVNPESGLEAPPDSLPPTDQIMDEDEPSGSLVSPETEVPYIEVQPPSLDVSEQTDLNGSAIELSVVEHTVLNPSGNTPPIEMEPHTPTVFDPEIISHTHITPQLMALAVNDILPSQEKATPNQTVSSDVNKQIDDILASIPDSADDLELEISRRMAFLLSRSLMNSPRVSSSSPTRLQPRFPSSQSTSPSRRPSQYISLHGSTLGPSRGASHSPLSLYPSREGVEPLNRLATSPSPIPQSPRLSSNLEVEYRNSRPPPSSYEHGGEQENGENYNEEFNLESTQHVHTNHLNLPSSSFSAPSISSGDEWTRTRDTESPGSMPSFAPDLPSLLSSTTRRAIERSRARGTPVFKPPVSSRSSHSLVLLHPSPIYPPQQETVPAHNPVFLKSTSTANRHHSTRRRTTPDLDSGPSLIHSVILPSLSPSPSPSVDSSDLENPNFSSAFSSGQRRRTKPSSVSSPLKKLPAWVTDPSRHAPSPSRKKASPLKKASEIDVEVRSSPMKLRDPIRTRHVERIVENLGRGRNEDERDNESETQDKNGHIKASSSQVKFITRDRPSMIPDFDPFVDEVIDLTQDGSDNDTSTNVPKTSPVKSKMTPLRPSPVKHTPISTRRSRNLIIPDVSLNSDSDSDIEIDTDPHNQHPHTTRSDFLVRSPSKQRSSAGIHIRSRSHTSFSSPPVTQLSRPLPPQTPTSTSSSNQRFLTAREKALSSMRKHMSGLAIRSNHKSGNDRGIARSPESEMPNRRTYRLQSTSTTMTPSATSTNDQPSNSPIPFRPGGDGGSTDSIPVSRMRILHTNQGQRQPRTPTLKNMLTMVPPLEARQKAVETSIKGLTNRRNRENRMTIDEIDELGV